MREEPSGRGDHHIGTGFQATALLVVGISVGSSVNRRPAHRHKIRESLELSVDLLDKRTGRCHYHAVNLILRISPLCELIDDGQ